MIESSPRINEEDFFSSQILREKAEKLHNQSDEIYEEEYMRVKEIEDEDELPEDDDISEIELGAPNDDENTKPIESEIDQILETRP